MEISRIFPMAMAALLGTGCAPVIDNVRLSQAVEGEQITVDADIKPYLTYIQTPVLEVGPYPPPHGPFEEAGTLGAQGNNHYQGTLAGQQYGGHELQISVPYAQGLLPFIRDTQYRYEKFYVDGPSSCFTFDGRGANTDDWRLAGVYDGDRPNRVSDLLPRFFWIESTNWPEPINAAATDDFRGSAGFEIDPLPFPNDPGLYETHFWRISYISPDLQHRPEWQDMEGVSLRFISEASGLKVQPLIKVRKNDGSIVHLYARGDDLRPLFHEITDRIWHLIEFPVQLPADVAAVLEIEIRVFGSLEMLPFNYDLESFLDGVCAL